MLTVRLSSGAFHPGSGLTIEKAWYGGARVRQAYSEKFIRPGGTVSGPTMMMLADFALYVAVLAAIGPVAAGAELALLGLLRHADGEASRDCPIR